MNNLIKDARHIPVDEAGMTVSYSPITLATPQRGRAHRIVIVNWDPERDIGDQLLIVGAQAVAPYLQG